MAEEFEFGEEVTIDENASVDQKYKNISGKFVGESPKGYANVRFEGLQKAIAVPLSNVHHAGTINASPEKSVDGNQR
jgi:hypothetical protein